MDIIGYFLLFFFIVVPVVLTGFNCVNLFRKKAFSGRIVVFFTMLLGVGFTVILISVLELPKYDMPLYLNQSPFFHEPFSSEHILSLYVIVAFALIGLMLLTFKKRVLPPLIQLFSIAAVFIGIVLALFWMIQLLCNIGNEIKFTVTNMSDIIFLCLFPFNYILCSIKLLHDSIRRNIQLRMEKGIVYTNPLLVFCDKLLKKSIGWYLFGFILILPLAVLILVVLVVFGQAPDSIIKTFTETSDWTLSQKISPPPIEYEGHYLCTVAVNGHKKVVKPTRCGIRHGEKIIVNRQLCVANAFEQLISIKAPHLHHFVRRVYDKYGYPLSKHITTKSRADFIYLAMKPLEWFFLLTLYLFDVDPENRIALQYISSMKSNSN